MGKEHHLAERRQAILNALAEAGQLSVSDLSARFDVSEVTIRMDLQVLHTQNLLLRTRGGAMAIDTLPELSFDVRQQQQADKKIRIGQAAAELVRPGDSIAVDASTTSLAIIPFIRHLPELTIFTNSLKGAISLLRMPQARVILPGGYLRRDSISMVGQPEDQPLADIHVRIGFLGARGLTLEQGLTDVNPEEVRTKRRMAEMCQTVVGVVDGSKWGQVAMATFASIDQTHMIITDDSAPPDLVARMRQRGVEVIQA